MLLFFKGVCSFYFKRKLLSQISLASFVLKSFKKLLINVSIQFWGTCRLSSISHRTWADPEGVGRWSASPGKSQVIWVSIGNKQLDRPCKKLDHPGKCWASSGTLKNDSFL